MPSALSFLDLHHDIRLKIYGYSGLIRPCPIELNVPDGYNPQIYGRSGEVNLCFEECLYVIRKHGRDRGLVSGLNYPDCLCSKLPTQLLCVSRGFYKDSFQVLYSKNKFVLRVQNANDIGLLLRLNNHVLSTMNSLLVRLNSWPCVRGHEEIISNGSKCYNCSTPSTKPDYTLSVTSLAGQCLLAEWKKLSFHFASAITPGQLKLSFICDVVDLESGKVVLEPLSKLPALKQCTIRLSRRPDYELSALARDTSAQNIHSFVQDPQPFPFKRLPRELRLHILGYTHFGRYNSYHGSDDLLRIQEGKLMKANIGFVHLSNKCCRQCTETLIDCCCPSTRAAHSTTCTCRRLPFQLFFVDRDMYRDAIAAFLRLNCFDFLQDPEKTINFLSRFPTGSLDYVRDIQFRFSEKEVRMWTQQDYSRKWLALVTFLKEHFKVLQLSIVVVAETFYLGFSLEYGDQIRSIYNVYCDITRSLRVLGRVSNIQSDLGWFTQLGPLMSRAVAKEGHEKLYPDLIVTPRDRNRPNIRIPHWFKESDLTEDVELSSM